MQSPNDQSPIDPVASNALDNGGLSQADFPVGAGSLAEAVQRLESAGLCGGPGQMPCQDAHELLHHYLDVDCDQELRDRIKGHLERCPSCDSEFAVYSRIVSSLSKCRDELPADAAARITEFCATFCSEELQDGDPASS